MTEYNNGGMGKEATAVMADEIANNNKATAKAAVAKRVCSGKDWDPNYIKVSDADKARFKSPISYFSYNGRGMYAAG